jgi:hypothetical protein
MLSFVHRDLDLLACQGAETRLVLPCPPLLDADGLALAKIFLSLVGS